MNILKWTNILFFPQKVANSLKQNYSQTMNMQIASITAHLLV